MLPQTLEQNPCIWDSAHSNAYRLLPTLGSWQSSWARYRCLENSGIPVGIHYGELQATCVLQASGQSSAWIWHSREVTCL